MVGLQTNNTLLLANLIFIALEQKKIKKAKFLTKEYKQLILKYLIKFNGGIIQQQNYIITLIQERQYQNLTFINIKEVITTTNSRGIIYIALIPKD